MNLVLRVPPATKLFSDTLGTLTKRACGGADFQRLFRSFTDPRQVWQASISPPSSGSSPGVHQQPCWWLGCEQTSVDRQRQRSGITAFFSKLPGPACAQVALLSVWATPWPPVASNRLVVDELRRDGASGSTRTEASGSGVQRPRAQIEYFFCRLRLDRPSLVLSLPSLGEG